MKKTVNILMMEPKQLLFNLTEKAIKSKPEEDYSLKIVRSALTAKAGYFELYKQKPHILLLNPELTDEDGESFIQHALERLPNLKIIVMTSKIQNEDVYLRSGASAIVSVPLQRASLWRTLDEVVEELDSTGLLDEVNEDESESIISTPQEDLFELDESDELVEFTPIFGDVTNHNATEEKPEEELEETPDTVDVPESVSPAQNPMDEATNEEVVDNSEVVDIEFEPLSFDSEPISVVDDKDVEIIDIGHEQVLTEGTAEDVAHICKEADEFEESGDQEQEESEEDSVSDQPMEDFELPSFDPYSFGEPPSTNEQNQVTEESASQSNDTPLFDFGATDFTEPTTEESPSETKEDIDDDSPYSFFKFDVEEDDSVQEESQIVEKEPIPAMEEKDTPLFAFETELPESEPDDDLDETPTFGDEPNDIDPTPHVEDSSPTPLLEFDMAPIGESTVESKNVETVKKDEEKQIKSFKSNKSSFARQKANIFDKQSKDSKKYKSFKNVDLKAAEKEPIPEPMVEVKAEAELKQKVEPKIEVEEKITSFLEEEPHLENETFSSEDVSLDTSNRPQTEKNLYLQKDEYNNTPAKRGHSFETGFFSKDGSFVPLYPPRESFSFIRDESEFVETVETKSHKKEPQHNAETEGVLSSVKKLFRRR